ncbi:hypothetical protein SCUCBS95973_000757 [Sporothrix curviconia]|uniref:mitogen-activated protein kinase n=1 Tax=Sporothrix curviconia TaxID=1260050 RepID=A0ABP0AT99_9PEZI
MAHPRTLFYLTPSNDQAVQALHHPENLRFVSLTPNFGEQRLGIGFHVSRVPGRVMARLGRGHNADIILPGRSISAIHVAFEIHPETHAVLLSVRAKRESSVTVAPAEKNGSGEKVEGDCVLSFDTRYNLEIGPYKFKVSWKAGTAAELQALAEAEYKEALKQEQYGRTRDLPTEDNSEKHTWHNTRIHTNNKTGPLFREAPDAIRTFLGEGAFGSVFKTVDLETGHAFAIKVIDLKKHPGGIQHARSAVHAEVKLLQRLKHVNIIELLRTDKWSTDKPEIWMPMRTGTLRQLGEAAKAKELIHSICETALEQILSALDYTAYNGVCHRDVKPGNILYYEESTGSCRYTFQLADFGVAKNQQSAINFGGTSLYAAPEVFDWRLKQTPKVDVWSLFATIIDMLPEAAFPPPLTNNQGVVFSAIQAVASKGEYKFLAPMVREDAQDRASAAQMLVAVFEGRGLTTPRRMIGPIKTLLANNSTYNETPIPAPVSLPMPGPSNAAIASMSRKQAPGNGMPQKATLPLIQYPRVHREKQLKRAARPRANPPPVAAVGKLLTPEGVGAALAAQGPAPKFNKTRQLLGDIAGVGSVRQRPAWLARMEENEHPGRW